MSEKEIQYCPLCGSEISGGGFMQAWVCDGCDTEMSMEVWGYTPEFWHRE